LEARLIDDLLDITRIAHKKLVLHRSRVNVHEQVEHALAMCREEAAGKGITLTAELLAADHTMDGDPARIQQIVWNLVKNGVKFTPAGGKVELRTSNPVVGRLVLTVSDTGIGFDSANAAYLFDAFEQGGREVTRQFGGLGLGLAICKSLAELHGGTIAAESLGKGLGATFRVELPLEATT
jgi:signal transduction histidine kinase